MKKFFVHRVKKISSPIFGFLFLLIFNGALNAQVSRTITGIVKDQKGDGLAGVSVNVENSTVGRSTDINGHYNITVAEGAKLVFTFIGYVTQKVSVKNQQNVHVILVQQLMGLQEVVMVAYGQQKKETVTGAIVSVGSKELIQTPVANISNALVGRVAGLFATQSSGEPGDNAATIRIRGVGTLNGSGEEPLVIIDGVQSTFSVMNAIDANEIESISVLKDVSATAVYGVRGANGVIILTTKRGKSGKPQISFSANYGVTALASRLKMLGSYDYAKFRNEAIKNDNDPSLTKLLFTDDELWKFKNNRDYTPAEVDALNITTKQKTALLASPALYYTSHDYFADQYGGSSPQQQYNINISGGSERIRYFTSVGYFSQKGVFKNSGYGGADINSTYDRYNFRSNYDIDLGKTLKLSVDLAGRFSSSGGILGGSQDGDESGSFSRHKAMMVAIFDSPPFAGPGIVDNHLVTSFVNNSNPLQQKGASGYSPITNLLTRPYLTNYNSNLSTNVKLTHTMDYLTKGLSVSGKVSYNGDYNKGIYQLHIIPQYAAVRNPANPAETLFYGGAVSPNSITDNYSNYKWRQLYFEAAINYNRNFKKHAVTAFVLANAQKTYDPNLLYNVPAGLMGLAGRVTYNYAQRYMVEVNIGYNGSENFPKSKRFGLFPAVSAGWNISNEKFFPKNDWANLLKVRGSYGVVGNDQIGGRRFLYLPGTWGYGGNYTLGGYSLGNTNGSSADPFYTGATESTVGNPIVTWEKAVKSNIGIEVAFFKNRLTGTVDIFSEKRNNILWELGTVPGIVGANLPPANIGRVSNKGYELQLGWADKTGNFEYSIKGYVSYARNKIDFMDEPAYPYKWMNTTGYSVGQYKGLLTDGFYNNDKEVANHPYSNIDGNKVQAGDYRYKDINGDGRIDSKDNVPIGYSNLPRYSFGSTISFGYKGFSITALFSGSAQGSLQMDFYLINPFYMTSQSAMQFQNDGRWTPEKVAQLIKPTFPRASVRTINSINGVFSDAWLQSTDHIRLKNVEVGYTFSKWAALKRSGIKRVRVYANGNNLYTWSHMLKGMDPEQQNSGGAGSGFVYPMTRIYNFGLSVQF